MKTFYVVLLFICAGISDVAFSAGRFPVAVIILSGIVLLYTYASPYILKK